MRRVWGRANSSNVMKVLWLLDELQLPYERIDVGGPFGKTDTSEYRAMNPVGLVPTYEEDEWSLFESNAILRYLINAHAAGSPLYPAEPRARARVDCWLDWQQCALTAPQGVVFIGLVRTPAEKRDQARINQGVADAGRMWGMVNDQLARHANVVGPDLTLADIAIGANVHRWFSFDIKRPEAPHLRAWYDRLLQRPPYQRHVAVPLT
jgi:glutathione S-transferase